LFETIENAHSRSIIIENVDQLLLKIVGRSIMIENEHKGQKAMQLARQINLLTRGNIVGRLIMIENEHNGQLIMIENEHKHRLLRM